MARKFELESVQSAFRVATTYLRASLAERDVARVELDIEMNGEGHSVQFVLSHVAKFEFTQRSFSELNYNNYAIVNEEQSFRGFIKDFDPKSRFKLGHCLLVGNDAYIEVLCSGDINILNKDGTTLLAL